MNAKGIEMKTIPKYLHIVYDINTNDGTAHIDRTNGNSDILVILPNKPKPYIQRFFINGTNEDLIEKTQLMKKLGVESYK